MSRLALVVALGLASSAPSHADPPPPTKYREIAASFVNVIPQGQASVLVINRGAVHGVALGDSAFIDGYPCELTEVYRIRSKCLTELPMDRIGHRPLVIVRIEVPAIDVVLQAQVVAQVLEESGSASLELDRGYVDGVVLGDSATYAGAPCLIWRVRQDTATCAIDVAGDGTGTVEIKPSLVPGRTLTEPEMLPYARFPPPLPVAAPGVRQPAAPLVIERDRGHGLFAPRRCLGFTPDARVAYVLVDDDTPASSPAPTERSLALERIDLAQAGDAATASLTSAATTRVHLDVMRPSVASRLLESLRLDEQLVACHVAPPRWVDPDGAGPREDVSAEIADHGDGQSRIVWSDDDGVVWAVVGEGTPTEVGRIPRNRSTETPTAPRYAPIVAMYFLPGAPLHLAQTRDGWLTVSVTPK